MSENIKDNYEIIRIDVSAYQARDYQEREREGLEKISSRLCYKKSPSQHSKLILITNSHTNFSQIDNSLFQRTKLLIHPNSGHDNIPKSLIDSADFPIILGNPIRSHSVASFILSELFRLIGAVPHTKNWDTKRQWNRPDLREINILVLGHGHIGQILEKTLSPIVKKIDFLDPYKNKTVIDELDQYHVLIPACGLNEKNKGMIDKSFLEKLREDIIFINGARGKLVVQNDLFSFLKENPKAQASLDVFEVEPFANIPDLLNLSTSSHIAGVTENLDSLILNFVKEVISHYLEKSEEEFLLDYRHLNLKNRLFDGFLI